jgi:UDP-N-acetylglucosamine acyltransferase
MVNSHVAHDCHVGNQVIIANNAMLAGHVTIDDRAYLSDATGVHQFCHVGRISMISGQARVTQDVPPFVTVDGVSNKVVGLNQVGLRRGGLTIEDIIHLKRAYRIFYRLGLPWTETIAKLKQEFPSGPAAEFASFIGESQRGIVQERRPTQRATVPFRTPLSSRDTPLRKAG